LGYNQSTVETIRATFQRKLDSLEPGGPWKRYLVGGGSLEPHDSGLRLTLSSASTEHYANAQIDDYQGLPRRRFAWHPPLRLAVQARFSSSADQLRGTAGFGFWNDPFLMTGNRLPALPRAIWFFYASPPSNMKLDRATPGYGWKAAAVDAYRPAALGWAALSPLIIPLMNLRPIYRALWPSIQAALGVREASLMIDMTAWHTYVLEWGAAQAHFTITNSEGIPVSQGFDLPSPKGPLGFVAWMDNQYLVATPWGQLRWGLLDIPDRQWMEIAQLSISPLSRDPTR
jgi:hypothetical protein